MDCCDCEYYEDDYETGIKWCPYEDNCIYNFDEDEREKYESEYKDCFSSKYFLDHVLD